MVAYTNRRVFTFVMFKCLAHWGWEKMLPILQRTFSNAFSWEKHILCFHSNFTVVYFKKSKWQLSIGSRWTGVKALPEQISIYIYDAKWRYRNSNALYNEIVMPFKNHEYIPYNIHMVLLCFVLYMFIVFIISCGSGWYIYWISSRFASLYWNNGMTA